MKKNSLNTEVLAKRVYELFDPWDCPADDDPIKTITETIKANPKEVIRYLLDYIDNIRP